MWKPINKTRFFKFLKKAETDKKYEETDQKFEETDQCGNFLQPKMYDAINWQT